MILEALGDYLQNTGGAFGAHASQGTLGTNIFLGLRLVAILLLSLTYDSEEIIDTLF